MDIILFLANDEVSERYYGDESHTEVVDKDKDKELRNFDINGEIGEGITLLMWAAYKSLTDIVKQQIDLNAEIDRRYNKTGATPLDLAIFKGYSNFPTSIPINANKYFIFIILKVMKILLSC